LPGVARRRIDDLPYAAVVLRRVLRATGARRVVFSASGLREGWLMQHMPPAVRSQSPVLAAAQSYAQRLGRDPALPPDLMAWTAPLFPRETTQAARLREAACWMSDLGTYDHPEFRAEQAFLHVLRQPGIGLDHHGRAFLALAVALRYEADADQEFLRPARLLLDLASAHRAAVLGIALRLAYTLSAGTRALLQGTALRVDDGRLELWLDAQKGVFAGESVMRRLDRLAQAVGLNPAIETLRAVA
jgi:exopolyphosphatase / guanosine-5'-triphosphate,3'-diphosphate pyrophosphatase